ncbi:MAG TPA: hypothetical protein EYP96_05490 [Nitrosopumilus sp.]|jgi:hypothetical protein|nr:hypothetical protein [Nitrosopumilus sp.]
MVSVFIIPIFIVIIVGLSGYLVYRLVMHDLLCKRSVNKTLQKYNIKKTPAQIIEEYYNNKGEQISTKEIQKMEKNYRQHEPDQFLAMYDATRDKSKTEK